MNKDISKQRQKAADALLQSHVQDPLSFSVLVSSSVGRIVWDNLALSDDTIKVASAEETGWLLLDGLVVDGLFVDDDGKGSDTGDDQLPGVEQD